MPSEHSHREHFRRRRASHDDAGASRPPVHISRPIEFGSQQKIRGPDEFKALDQVRDERGPGYNPLQRKRSGSVSRAWQAVKRSLSRHGEGGNGRRHSFIGVLFGEEEERGRGRDRPGSEHGPRAHHYASPSKRHSHADASAVERERSHRHRSGSKKHSDRHSHHSDRHEAKPRKSEAPSAALDPRKSVGPPYDSDITSDWYWKAEEGIWAPALVRGALVYEALDDTDYELITGRKRGVFPPKPRRHAATSKDKSHALDNQVYFDKETSTYRALKVKTTDAARPASKEHTSHTEASKRKSVRGSVDYAQSDRERPTSQWPSVLGGVMDSSSDDDERTPRVTRFPTVTPTTVLPYNRSSSIYPEDQDQTARPASSTAPPVPCVPTRYADDSKYVHPRKTKAWQEHAAAGPAPGSVSYIQANFAEIAKQNPYMQNTTTVATASARPGSVLNSSFLQPADAGGNNTVWETDYPSTWDTQVPLDLKGKKPVEIPGLEPIYNQSMNNELQRLSLVEKSRKGKAKRRKEKTDTIDGIIDAYAEPLRTRWEGDEE